MRTTEPTDASQGGRLLNGGYVLGERTALERTIDRIIDSQIEQ